MKSKRICAIGRKVVCAVASASMVALMVPSASLAAAKSAQGAQSEAAAAAASTAKVPRAAASKITITVKRASTGAVTMKAGTSYALKATASKGTLVYSSSNKKAVTVTSAGTLKAVKAGSAVVTVKVKGTSVAKKISVKVVKASKFKAAKSIGLYYNTDESDPYSTTYKAKTCTAVGSAMNMGIGACMTLCAKFNPTAASNKNLVYASSNAKAVKVTAEGIVSVVGEGDAKITVTSCSNSSVKASFKISANEAVRDSSVADLTCEQAMVKGAKYAYLDFTSDVALKDDLGADDIFLAGTLKEYEITEVNVYDSHSFGITVYVKAGEEQEAREDEDSLGNILVYPDAFASSVDYGYSTVAMKEAVAKIDTDSDLCSYNKDTGVLTLAIDLGTAQVGSNFTSADVTLPADTEGAIGIERVTVDSVDSSQVFIGFRLDALNAGKSFEEFDTFLSNGGIKINGEALSSGADLVVTSEQVDQGKEYGYEVSALDYLRPSLIGYVSDVDWALDDEELTATLHVDLSVESIFASIYLGSSEEVAESVSWGDDGGLFTNCGKSQYEGKTKFSFKLQLDREDAEICDIVKDGAVDKVAANKLLNTNLGYQDAHVKNGLVENGLGIPMEDVSAQMVMDGALVNEIDDESDSSGSTKSLKSKTLKADEDAEEPEDDGYESGIDWEELRSYASQLITAVGSLAWGISSSDWGYISAGIGGLVGFEFGDNSPSTQDIMDKLDVMESKLDSISDRVDGINTRLNEIESRTIYQTDLSQLRTLLTKTEVYGKPVARCLRTINADKTAGSYAVNERQWIDAEALAENVKDIEERHKNFDAYADAIDLGKLLYGDSGTSIVQEYAEYVGTYYNWQPETVSAVAAFYTRVTLAYENAYRAAYIQRQVELKEYREDLEKLEAAGASASEIKAANRKIDAVSDELSDLGNNHKQVTKVMVGELTEDGTYNMMGDVKVKNYKVKTESDVSKLTYVDESAQTIKCLVNGNSYSKDAFSSKTLFGNNTVAAAKGWVKNDAEDIKAPDGTSSFTSTDWKTMFTRLSGTNGGKTLKEEIVEAGFSIKDSTDLCFKDVDNKNSTSRQEVVYRQVLEDEDLGNEVLIGSTNMVHLRGVKNSWHEYCWVGQVVDLNATSKDSVVKDSESVLFAREFYYDDGWVWNWHWSSKYTLKVPWVVNG